MLDKIQLIQPLGQWLKWSGQHVKLVGQLASGQVMSLMFIIPVLWLLSLCVSMSDVSILLYSSVLKCMGPLNSNLEMSSNTVSMTLLVFCLLLTGHILKPKPSLPGRLCLHYPRVCFLKQNSCLLGGLCLPWPKVSPWQRLPKPKPRNGLRHSCACIFRKKMLPFNMVLGYKRPPLRADGLTIHGPFFICRKTQKVKSRYTLQDWHHCCWGRRQPKSKCCAWRRQLLCQDKLCLTPWKSSTELWNRVRTLSSCSLA